MKIGIVGPQESRWPPELIPKANLEIKKILVLRHTKGFLDVADNVLVSGHCPVGEELWYCVTCGRWIPHRDWLADDFMFTVTHKNHKMLKVYDKGGVDTWAEIIATELGIRKEIYPAERHPTSNRPFAWEDRFVYEDVADAFGGVNTVRHTIKGFRSRNIQTAEVSDVMYCIVPFIKGHACSHHSNDIQGRIEHLNHPNNGGCWTMQCAKKLGKETHLVVIE